MMTKAKQRFIALVLAIAIAASVIVTVNIMKPVSAEASSDFMDIPQITVATQFYGHSLKKDINGRK